MQESTLKIVFSIELTEATKQFLTELMFGFKKQITEEPVPKKNQEETPVKKLKVPKPKPAPAPAPAPVELDDEEEEEETALPAKKAKTVTAKKPFEDEEEEIEEEENVSMTQIREMISFKIAEQKTPKIKTLLGVFKVPNAAALPKEQFASFYKKLRAL